MGSERDFWCSERDFWFCVVICILVGSLGGAAISLKGRERAEKEHALTVRQAAHCPDRAAASALELRTHTGKSPCPWSHFCRDCLRHW